MKRTLKRKWNSTWNRWKQANRSVSAPVASRHQGGHDRSGPRQQARQHLRVRQSPSGPQVEDSRGALPLRRMRFQDRAVDGAVRPVLKHGPRSLTWVRVVGWQTLVRREIEIAWAFNRVHGWQRVVLLFSA